MTDVFLSAVLRFQIFFSVVVFIVLLCVFMWPERHWTFFCLLQPLCCVLSWRTTRRTSCVVQCGWPVGWTCLVTLVWSASPAPSWSKVRMVTTATFLQSLRVDFEVKPVFCCVIETWWTVVTKKTWVLVMFSSREMLQLDICTSACYFKKTKQLTHADFDDAQTIKFFIFFSCCWTPVSSLHIRGPCVFIF